MDPGNFASLPFDSKGPNFRPTSSFFFPLSLFSFQFCDVLRSGDHPQACVRPLALHDITLPFNDVEFGVVCQFLKVTNCYTRTYSPVIVQTVYMLVLLFGKYCKISRKDYDDKTMMTTCCH
jgi:hypothetical protein